jgi:ABC-type nitrate/sulfonate/bicarbonate transport system substrate-binding protein
VTRSRLLAVLSTVLALVVSGCAGAADDGRTIRIALDWTPNTNHTGLFVAEAEGWFAEAGLDVEFLPYNSTSPDTLVSAGAAEFGISFQDSFTFSKAAGADITSVMAVLQHWGSEIAVRADRADITSPADLDGAVYGGFGGPGEVPKMQAVIRGAGGAGEFSTVVLGTSAYEALYAGEVDFTEPFVAWEGVEAELRGEPLKTFRYTDFGFPDAYSVLLVGSTPWLQEHPEQADAFVAAAQRGYTLGADDPDRAARILLDANADVLTEPELVVRSQRMLAERYLRAADGTVGTQTAEQWAGYSGFVFDSGVLTGPDGGPLTERPDFETWFTNDHLAP